MRSNLITVVTAVASVLLVGQVATADPVQEQLRLMEQRMAEMEDRLAATSDELKTTKATAAEQQDLLTEAGLIETDENGVRSAVGTFLQQVDVSGVVAASYNHRLLDLGDDVTGGGNVGYFRHPDSNTFALDQVWLVVEKAATEESRGGFHFEAYTGKTKVAQNGGGSFAFDVYNAYASYLAPIGSGVQVDAGLLATPLGAEVIQTNQNFNITTGLVFGLQPVTHTGIQFSTALSDSVTLTAGVVNDVYSNTNIDVSNGKAGYAQLAFSGDSFGLNIGAIVGSNEGQGGCGFIDADDECNTSVFDVVASASLSENIDVWANFDWVHNFGDSTVDGDAYGVSAAGRVGLTESTGFATRVEYVRAESSFNTTALGPGALAEILSLTGTVDHALTDGVKIRGEVRWDRRLDSGPAGTGFFVNGQNGAGNAGFGVNSSRDDQVVVLGEIYYEF